MEIAKKYMDPKQFGFCAEHDVIYVQIPTDVPEKEELLELGCMDDGNGWRFFT